MKRTMIWGLMLLIGAALMAGNATARGKGGYRDDRAMPRLERRVDRLDLSEEQREQIEKIRETAQEDVAALRKGMLRLQSDLRGEMLEDAPDAGKLRRLAEQMGEIRTQMQIHRLETQLAVREVLTPDQRDRMILRQGRRGHPGFGAGAGLGWSGPGGWGPGGCDGPGAFRGRHAPAGPGGRGGRWAHPGACGEPGWAPGCGAGHPFGPPRGQGCWLWEGGDDDSTSAQDENPPEHRRMHRRQWNR